MVRWSGEFEILKYSQDVELYTDGRIKNESRYVSEEIKKIKSNLSSSSSKLEDIQQLDILREKKKILIKEVSKRNTD